MSRPSQLNHFPSSHQELSLYAHVTAARQPQLLRILSGIAGMSPERYLQHHLVYKPSRPAPPSGPGRGAGELFYIQLVSRVPERERKGEGSEEENGREPGGMEGVEKTSGAETAANGEERKEREYDPRKQRWAMRLEDLPEVTRKPVVSRNVYSANTGEGDVVQFMKSLGYTLQTAYFTNNLRLIHGNIVITLTRVLVPPPPRDADPVVPPSIAAAVPPSSAPSTAPASSAPSTQSTLSQQSQPAQSTQPSQPAAQHASSTSSAPTAATAAAPSPASSARETAQLGSPWPEDRLVHVDPAQSWVLQAAVRVASATDVESVAAAVAELVALRETLRGVCELDVVERLALDTRVR